MFLIDLIDLEPWVLALGWALVHFIWQGVAIGGLFAAGKLLLQHARPQSRYLLGLGCMLLLLVAPVVTFVALFQQGAGAMASAPTASVATLGTTAPAGFDFGVWIENSLPWVVLAWLAGVFVMSGRVSLNWYRLYRCLRVGVRELDSNWRERVELLCHLFGIRRTVRVLESALVQVPTVFGWLKPVVLLPTSSLIGLTPAQLELVIAHELGHIRRFDYVLNLFQVTVETLLFYHPVVAWISRHVRQEREQCCDDLVVTTCGNRLEYARALANLETIRSTGFISPALAATDGELLQRIERIVCTHGRPRNPVFGSSGLMLLVAAAIILGGRVADPMAAFEAKRNLLADALVAELWISDGSHEPFAPLEEARIAIAPVSPVEAPPPAAPLRDDPSPAEPPPAAPLRDDPSPAQPSPEPQTSAVSRQPADARPAPADPTVHAWEQAEVEARPEAPTEPMDLERTPAKARPAEALQLASVGKQPDFSAPAKPGPVAVVRVSPDYPVRARIAGQRGFVELEFSVRPDGRVSDVRVADSRPRRVFDRAAIKAIRRWRFDPMTLNPDAGARLTQRFDFNIGQGSTLSDPKLGCLPVTGTRICRPESPTSLLSQEAHVDSTSH